MISIVASMGTFVNKLWTSSDAKVPHLRFTLRISINSSDDLSEYVLGIYGAMSAFRVLASWYEAVGTCEMIGLNGLPVLCVLTFP